MRFVSRPVTIEAVQWTGENATEMTRFAERAVQEQSKMPQRWWIRRHSVSASHWLYVTEGRPEFRDAEVTAALWVQANESWLPIRTREWVAMDQLGLYPIKDEVMRQKYRPADTDAPSDYDQGYQAGYHAGFAAGSASVLDAVNEQEWKEDEHGDHHLTVVREHEEPEDLTDLLIESVKKARKDKGIE